MAMKEAEGDKLEEERRRARRRRYPRRERGEEKEDLSILSLRFSVTSHGRKYHTVREVQSAGLLRGPGLDLSRTRTKIFDPVVIHTCPFSWRDVFVGRSVDVGDASLTIAFSNSSQEVKVANRKTSLLSSRNATFLREREVGRPISPT